MPKYHRGHIKKSESRSAERTYISAGFYQYFTYSKFFLIKRFDSLNSEQKQAVNTMLWYSAELCEAHAAKEWFFRVLDTENPSIPKRDFLIWLNSAGTSDLQPFKRCVRTYFHWRKGIFHSLTAPYTNGFTEGCNNKIKVLKRNAYGYRNFDRFRNRILHIFSHQNAA